MTPFFSIIIPTYNRASMLPIAIRSIIDQSYTGWQLIIVDDGSTDNTREEVAKFNDPRIQYIYQENAERSAARNNGISHAVGQYLCFLDSDDYYLKDRLELLHLELVKRNFPVALLYTGLLIDNDGKINKRSENQDIGANIFDRIAFSVIHSQQVCIYNDILKVFKYDTRFHIGEDMELWLRIAAHYPLVYLENQFTIVTVEHEDRSVNIKKNSSQHQLRLFRYIFLSGHPGSRISPAIKANLLANCYFAIGKYYIYSNFRFTAIAYVLRAIFTDFKSNQFKFRCNVLLKLITFSSMKDVNKLIEF